jgi:hypothetical protein
MRKHLKNQFQRMFKRNKKTKTKKIVTINYDWDLFFRGQELI